MVQLLLLFRLSGSSGLIMFKCPITRVSKDFQFCCPRCHGSYSGREKYRKMVVIFYGLKFFRRLLDHAKPFRVKLNILNPCSELICNRFSAPFDVMTPRLVTEGNAIPAVGAGGFSRGAEEPW